jgi:pilus assembly protein Flp/PilA
LKAKTALQAGWNEGRREEMEKLVKFLKDEEGVTAIEYGLIAALVGVAAIAALTTLGGNLTTLFTTVGTTVSGS